MASGSFWIDAPHNRRVSAIELESIIVFELPQFERSVRFYRQDNNGNLTTAKRPLMQRGSEEMIWQLLTLQFCSSNVLSAL